ncbi:MAG: T9SS type A sorting domain-containing protein [Bacteroidales bacterium]|nr:T9SS type A sorting domain-containing protein [Bacteroidales bacterium]
MFHKKAFLALFIICPLLSEGLSQEYSYVPFPDSNAVWSEIYYPPAFSGDQPTCQSYVLFNEDTVINDKTYHKLYRLNDTVIDRQNAIYMGGIREDSSKRVYYLGKHPFPSDYPEDEELLLYDFSVDIGDTVRNVMFALSYQFLVVTSIDTLSFFNDNSLRKRINFDYPFVKWMEGIGNNMGLLFFSGDIPSDGTWNDLICFFHNDTLIYHYSVYDGCFCTITGIDEKRKTDDIEIVFYPNPMEKVSLLRWNTTIFENLEILNLNGMLLDHSNISGLTETYIYKSEYRPGLYIYRLTTRTGDSVFGKFQVR